MGLVAQRPCPLPMTIFDNVAYGPRIHGMKKRKAINQTVIQYLQYVGLWDEVRDRVRTSATRLSIGQQQRLCLARGLAIEPEYILGDEATSALDPLSTKKIEELFVKLKEKYTIILVTHEEDIALHAHRRIRLRDGKMEVDEPIKNRKILTRPTTVMA